MYKYSLLIFSILIISFSLKAQQEETRNFDSFHSIYLFGNIDAELIQSDSNYAVLRSDFHNLGKVSTQIKDGQLYINNSTVGNSKSISIKLYYKSIDEIIAKAGVKLQSESFFTLSYFKIRLSKGAVAKVKIKTDSLYAVVHQGSELIIEGSTNHMNISSNSGGYFNGFKLQATNAYLRSVTGAKLEVNVNGRFEAYANTGGMIFYEGNPKISSQKAITGAKIQRKIE